MHASTARPATDESHASAGRPWWGGADLRRTGLVVAGAVVVVAVLSAVALIRAPSATLLWLAPAILLAVLALQASARWRGGSGDRVELLEADAATMPGQDRDVSPQALALQVRSLEAVLAEREDRTEEVRRAARSELERALGRDRERVRLVMDAMRGVVAEQPGDVALNRLEAALGRIGGQPGFVRPPLCLPPSGGRPVTLSAPRSPHDPVPGDAGPAEAGSAPTDADPPTAPVDEDPPVSPAEPQRVMPVPAPPPAPATVPTRGRLRRRRSSRV